MCEEEFERITVKVPKKFVGTLEMLDMNNSEHIREEMLERLMWDDKEIFFGDLLCYGSEKAIEEGPNEFIRRFREERIPMFKEDEEFEKKFERSLYIR